MDDMKVQSTVIERPLTANYGFHVAFALVRQHEI